MTDSLLQYVPAPKQPRRRWPIVIAIIVGALALIPAGLTIVAILVFAFVGMGIDTETVSPADAERLGRFTFPETASNVRVHLVSWQDYYLRVRFSMPPEAIEAFASSTLCDALSSTEIPWQILSSTGEVNWWINATPTVFDAGSGNDGLVVQHILIDKANPKSYEVYLLAHDW